MMWTCLKKRKAFLAFVIVMILLYVYNLLNKKLIHGCTQSRTRWQLETMGWWWNLARRDATVLENRHKFDYHACRKDKLDLYNTSISNASTKQVNAIAEYECSHLMSVKEFNGRFGNNMFQAASVIGMAFRHGYTPVFANASVLLKVFELKPEINFKLENIRNLNERVCCEYNSNVSDLSHDYNWTLSGFLQSWKYFKGAEDKVRKAFTFKEMYMAQAREYLRNISTTGYLYIGVHIRRGDFLLEEKQQLGYVTVPVSYIQKAMIYFFERFKTVQFIFISDDLSWCKANLNFTSVYFSPFKDFATDMALLTLCDHVIITGGTFGWWIGWLSKGITVYYQGYPKNGSWLATQFNVSGNYYDYYPRDWIGMD